MVEKIQFHQVLFSFRLELGPTTSYCSQCAFQSFGVWMKQPATLPRVGFLLEQTLGHVTHSQNLRQLVSKSPSIDAVFHPIPFDCTGLAAQIPLYRSNWSIRAGIRACSAISALEKSTPLDALFIHTQVPAVLVRRSMKRIPTVVSLDATPVQYDKFGSHYQHQLSSSLTERGKWVANRSCYRRAAGLVAWSEWTKSSVVNDYGIDPDRVTVIPPGVVQPDWKRPSGRPHNIDVVRILFVGGDMERKGGLALLQAFRMLRSQQPHNSYALRPQLELHLVTRSAVADEPGVVVHNALEPNSSDLKELFHASDIFCLPTRGDCLPMVLSEAGASGLPLISTRVGAIEELVIDNKTGLLVPPDDVAALTNALGMLVDDADLRRRLGSQAAVLVGARHDAERNAIQLVELLRSKAAVP